VRHANATSAAGPSTTTIDNEIASSPVRGKGGADAGAKVVTDGALQVQAHSTKEGVKFESLLFGAPSDSQVCTTG
jgi:hypothetical protein